MMHDFGLARYTPHIWAHFFEVMHNFPTVHNYFNVSNFKNKSVILLLQIWRCLILTIFVMYKKIRCHTWSQPEYYVNSHGWPIHLLHQQFLHVLLIFCDSGDCNNNKMIKFVSKIIISYFIKDSIHSIYIFIKIKFLTPIYYI